MLHDTVEEDPAWSGMLSPLTFYQDIKSGYIGIVGESLLIDKTLACVKMAGCFSNTTRPSRMPAEQRAFHCEFFWAIQHFGVGGKGDL